MVNGEACPLCGNEAVDILSIPNPLFEHGEFESISDGPSSLGQCRECEAIFRNDKDGISANMHRELLDAVERVLYRGRIVMSPEVGALGKAIAKQSNRSSAVAVSSGTAALYLALRCLDLGLGDEVIS